MEKASARLEGAGRSGRWRAAASAAVALFAAASAHARPNLSQITLAPAGPAPTQQVRTFAADDLYYPNQWHLSVVNAPAAWARGITGQGVVIGIVDDSLQWIHPDLYPNYSAINSWNFGQNNSDPSPVYGNDQHGISVGGLAAGRGGNGIGITGVAPLASLAGLRVDFPYQTPQMFVNATLYHSSGADRRIRVKNHSYGNSVGFESDPEGAAIATSAAAGTINCYAAGNDRAYHGYYVFDANGNGKFDPGIDPAYEAHVTKKTSPGSRFSIAVGALNHDNKYAYYSNFGANLFCTAPSNGTAGYGIVTTDTLGSGGYNTGAGGDLADADYTNAFGGTSAATPIVSGIMALGAQVNPHMDVRMAKHLLAKTCKVADPTDAGEISDGGWKTNGAGYRFDQNYGFGLIDADAFTLEAAKYVGVTPEVAHASGLVTVNAAIPDAGHIVRTFTLDGTGEIEVLEVALNITHSWRGHVEAFLTSPSGLRSRLFYRNGADSFQDIDWTFSTNAFWGEGPAGTWSLDVYDVYSGDTGTWNNFAVTAYTGELILPEPAALALLAMGAIVALRRRRTTR
jgi:subtilisin family serine protease